jgi:hypothetical protein
MEGRLILFITILSTVNKLHASFSLIQNSMFVLRFLCMFPVLGFCIYLNSLFCRYFDMLVSLDLRSLPDYVVCPSLCLSLLFFSYLDIFSGFRV